MRKLSCVIIGSILRCRKSYRLSSIFFSCVIFSSSCLVLGASAQYEMKYPNGYYLPESWPQHTLALSEEGRFIDVFRAGIKPHYFPGMEKTLVEAKHVRVRIEEPSGRVLPEFAAETVEIRPLPDGTLNRMTFVSQPLTIEEASLQVERPPEELDRE